MCIKRHYILLKNNVTPARIHFFCSFSGIDIGSNDIKSSLDCVSYNAICKSVFAFFRCSYKMHIPNLKNVIKV